MRLSPMIYENLTPRQRIIATVEAEARDDKDEVRRLVKSCPKKTYLATDAAYQDKMVALMATSLAVECELRELTICILLAKERNHRNLDIFLQNMADIEASWHSILETLGIDSEAMAKAGAPRCFMATLFLDCAPPPNPENVQRIREKMKDLLEDI